MFSSPISIFAVSVALCFPCFGWMDMLDLFSGIDHVRLHFASDVSHVSVAEF